VRFGSRLRVVREIDEQAAQCAVPPLLLQPLIENAIGHGIAGLVDGGTIRLAMTYPDAARFDASADTNCYRVEIDLPCVEE